MSGRTIKRALLIFIPLAVAAVVVPYLLYASQVSAIRVIAESAEDRIVDIARQRVTLPIGSAMADASYLAEQAALGAYLAEGDEHALRQLEAEYLAFVKNRQTLDQISLLDPHGQEIVRINRAGADAESVPPGTLQNKADRYYVTKALKLDRGQVFVSPLELDVEGGADVQPATPIIRLGVPVFDATGAKRGIIVVNYLAQRILDRIIELRDAASEIWMLNEEGYWIVGPDDRAFAFMDPERKDRTFAAAYPDIWQQMHAAPAGQITTDLGRFTYTRVDSPAAPSGAAEPPGPSWFMLVHTPRAVSAAQTSDLRRNFLAATGGLLLLVAGVSWGFADYQVHRREAEQHLRLSEAKFRAVAETAGEAIISADADGNIRYFNPGAERIFGCTDEEIVGQSLTRLMPERFRKAHVEGLRRYLETRKGRVIGKTVELVGQAKDGREFPIELALASSEVDGDTFFTAIVRDITVRAEAERQLRASEARFRDLLDSAPDAVLITDDEGRIQLANAQAEVLFGHRREEMVGQPIEMLIPERYRGAHVGHRLRYVAAAQTRPMGAGLELHGLRKDGSEFPVSISLSPTRTADGLTVFCSVRDITEQQANEAKIQELNQRLRLDNAELMAVNKELEAFSYSVSHDLRAPLRAIDGFSQALVEDAGPLLSAEHHGHLIRVRQAAQRMGFLIDDLIKLARVTRTDLSIEDVDLSAIAQEIANSLQDSMPERQAEFAIAPGLRSKGDSRLLQVALDNLLSNSWKFTAPRSPARIEFGATRIGGKPAFFVRDNGVGFDMAYAGKMFGAFQRFHDTREFAGTGIGLATVQRIVHKHGGRIWADSEPGNGATFFFTL